jgi:hypothetical protein
LGVGWTFATSLQIVATESKSKGGSRYDVQDVEEKMHNVGEKQLHFVVPQPPSSKDQIKLLKEFEAALK